MSEHLEEAKLVVLSMIDAIREEWGMEDSDIEKAEYVIQQAERVKELENLRLKDLTKMGKLADMINDLRDENQNYKRALENIRKEAIEHKKDGYSIQHWALIKKINLALEGLND